MAARVIEIADAVVARINGASLSVPVTAVRAYRPEWTLAELESLRCTVVPVSLAAVPLDRGRDTGDYVVDVALQRRLPDESNATIDGYMLLVEEVAELFRWVRFDPPADAKCVAVQNDPIYAPEHLEERRVFTSLLTLTFRTWG